MRPLQDKCDPTDYEHLEGLFLTDMGHSIEDIFVEFDPNPIGVASLAQVHVGRLRETGRQVAVKVCGDRLHATLLVQLTLSTVATSSSR